MWLDSPELAPKFTHHGELQNRGLIGYTRFKATAEATIPDMAAWSNCEQQITSCTGRGGRPYWSFRVVTRYPGPTPAIYRLCRRDAGPPSALKPKSAVKSSNDRLYEFGHTFSSDAKQPIENAKAFRVHFHFRGRIDNSRQLPSTLIHLPQP